MHVVNLNSTRNTMMGVPVTTVGPDGQYVKAIPDSLVSGTTSPRVRVDSGQTGFFEGRMFRSYREIAIPVAGPAVSLKYSAAVNFILWSQSLEITQGAIRLEVYIGGTESGTWTAITPTGVNRMSVTPVYSPQNGLSYGGSFTGGALVDVIMLRSSSANNTATNVGGSFSERGLSPGTYHIRISTLTGGLTVNDAAQGIYSIIWEERP